MYVQFSEGEPTACLAVVIQYVAIGAGTVKRSSGVDAEVVAVVRVIVAFVNI